MAWWTQGTRPRWLTHLMQAASRPRRRPALVGLVAVLLLPLGACTGSLSPSLTPTPTAGLCTWRGGEAKMAPPAPVVLPTTAPFAAGSAVYIGYESQVRDAEGWLHVAALRKSDGTLLWDRSDPMEGGSTGTSTFAMAGGTLLLSNGSDLAALRASDGMLLWRRPGLSGASLVVDRGVVYTSNDAGINAVRVADGRLLWQVPPPANPVTSSANGDNPPYALGPLVSGGAVYVGYLNGPLVAVRASDGARLWQTFVVPPSTNGVPTRPQPLAVAGGVLYIETGYDVRRVRTSDGTVLGLLQGPPGAEPMVVDGTLYLSLIAQPEDGGPMTYTLLTGDGRQRLWSRQVPISIAPARVVAHDAGLLFVWGGDLIALRLADGAVRWRLPWVSGWGPRPPVAAGGRLYASQSGLVDLCDASRNRTQAVCTLNEADGRVAWVRSLDGERAQP